MNTAALALVVALVAMPSFARAKPSPSTDALARATVLVQRGKTVDALRIVDQLERDTREPRDPAMVAGIAKIRGDVSVEIGDYKSAYALYNVALETAQKAGLTSFASDVLYQFAAAYSDQGDWARSLEYETRSFEANPAPDDRLRARHLYWRGVVSLELNDPAATEAALREGLAFAERASDLTLIAQIHRRSCILEWRLRRNRPGAVAECEVALSYARRARASRAVVNILNNYANVFRTGPSPTNEDRIRALQLYREGVVTARRDAVAGVLPTLLKNIGVIYGQLGRSDEAASALQDAVREADAIGLTTASWQGRVELARLSSERDPAAAGRYYSESIDLLEAQNASAGVLLEDFRAGSLAGSLTLDNPYEEYIDLLLAQHDAERAFLVAERYRARSFLSTLSQARDQIASAIPSSFVAEERQLLQKISSSQLVLRTGDPDAESRRKTMASIAEDERQLERLRVHLATDHPEVGNARFPHLWSVGELQRLIGRETAIVAFSLRKQKSTAWVIRGDALDVIPLPGRTAVDATVRPLLTALQNPRTDARSAAKPLEALFVGPLMRRLPGIQRLIVVPDGALSYVPFEALSDSSSLLAERFDVAYAPSASSYAFLRARSGGIGDQVVAVGNPIVRVSAPGETRGAAIERIGLLQPLPSTSDELRAIARTFPGATRTLEQQQATEAALAAADLSRAGILHFATHGVIDEDQPQRSGLALTAVPPASDGILQMREIYGLKLRAALVTLSACQTGLGKNVTGEGLIGLSRAFFYAGANAVMASLWNVDDASTAQFMGEFYRALRNGAAIDDAARQAKRAFLGGDARLRHPYYWAGFIVTGNASARVRIAFTPRWRLALPYEAAAIVAGLAVVAFMRRRTAHPRAAEHSSQNLRRARS